MGDVRACQLACATGDAARTRKLLKESSNAYALANSHDANGTTALMRAAYCRADGAAACVAALLEAGADPLQRDKRGGDALRWAANNHGVGREAEAGENVRNLLTAALESSSCRAAPAPPTAQTMDLEGGGMRSRPCIVSGSSIQRNTQCEEIYEPLTSRHKSRTSAREPACAVIDSTRPELLVVAAVQKVIRLGKKLAICPCRIVTCESAVNTAGGAGMGKTVRSSEELESERQGVEPGSLVDIIFCATSSSNACNSDDRTSQCMAPQSSSLAGLASNSEEATAVPTLPAKAAQTTGGLQAANTPVARVERMCTMSNAIAELAVRNNTLLQHRRELAKVEAMRRRRERRVASTSSARPDNNKRKWDMAVGPEKSAEASKACAENDGGKSAEKSHVARSNSTSEIRAQTFTVPDTGAYPAVDILPLDVQAFYRALSMGRVDDGRERLLRCVCERRETERNKRGVLVLHAVHVVSINVVEDGAVYCNGAAHIASGKAAGISGSTSEEQQALCSPSCTSTHSLYRYDYDMRQLMATRGDNSVSMHASVHAGTTGCMRTTMRLGAGCASCTDTHAAETTAEKETRHVHFAQWLVRVFGKERLSSGTGIVDVAGGKGALYAALCSALASVNDGTEFTNHPATSTSTAATDGAVSGPPPQLLTEPRYTLIEPAHSSMPAALRSAVAVRCGNNVATTSVQKTLHTAPVRPDDCSAAAAETALAESVLHVPLLFGPELWTRDLAEADPDVQALQQLAMLKLRGCGVVVGMHPDQATEAIVDFALAHGKSFAVVPCCVFPSLAPQRRVRSGQRVVQYPAFIQYLAEKHHGIRVGRLPFAGKNIVLYLCA